MDFKAIGNLRVLIAAAFVVCMEGKPTIAQAYQQTNLVSDIQGFAQNPNAQPDTQLLNPWGLVASPTSPWWVSDNNAGVATLYNGQGVKQGLVVDIPSPVSGVAGTPAGVVFTGATGFSFQTDGKTAAAAFTFVTDDGTSVAWAPGINPTYLVNDAFVVVDNSNNPTAATGPAYKGATIAQMTKDGPSYFYVTNNRLWALQFGNRNVAGPSNSLFFTAGVGDEAHGLFGFDTPSDDSAPEEQVVPPI